MGRSQRLGDAVTQGECVQSTPIQGTGGRKHLGAEAGGLAARV
ncbi:MULTISPECIES: hypothetical protein [Halobacterium]|nr:MULTISPECIES: hypothetical protein [Halobacterium]WJK63992.1 hypothetical protein QSJ49_02120 [Halobacterium salinarum]